MNLLASFGVRRGEVVSVVGAGGKTTLVYALAQQAHGLGWRVVVTTTTHMGTLPEEVTGPVFVEEGVPAAGLGPALQSAGRVTLLGRRVRPDKLEGVSPARVDELRSQADLVLVEADGARGRSLKLPAAHEPVVASSTTLMVVVAALDVLGCLLDEEKVHRLERVREAAGVVSGPVDEEVLARVLKSPGGYLAAAPPAARVAVFLNKAEGEERRAAASRLGARLVPPYSAVVAGSARAGTVAARVPALA